MFFAAFTLNCGVKPERLPVCTLQTVGRLFGVGAHLAALPQHVQVLQAVSGQVAQGPLSQHEVLVGLANQREAQTLDPQPQSTHLLREGVSGSEAHRSAVGLLHGQRLLTGHHLHQQPT